MIITALMDLIYHLLDLLLVLELPAFPDSIVQIFNTIPTYLQTGLSILRVFVGSTAFTVIGVCLKVVVFANVAYFTITLVFFVLKKIPILGIKQ